MLRRLPLLILTDEPIFSFGLRVQFQKWGFTWIDIVETSLLAIQSIRKQAPSLIVLDEKFLQSPILDNHLMPLIEQQAIPSILLTILPDSIRAERGFDEKTRNYVYLNKPCQIADLKQAVEGLLHIHMLST